jgi:hypothetical protein
MAANDATDAQLPAGPERPKLSEQDQYPGGDLSGLEEDMVAAAALGEPVDRRDGPLELDLGQAWGEERTVRAAVLRWLLVAGRRPLHARGIQLHGVRIGGCLDLEGAALLCPLLLENCYFDAEESACFDYALASRITLTRCQLPGLTGKMLTASELDLTGSTFTGPVRLFGANITGTLDCSGAKLNGTDSDPNALAADLLTAGGGVFLREVVTDGGAVRLYGANVTGTLSFSGASLNGIDGDGNALVADYMRAGADVLLDKGFSAAGAVRLYGANITGTLSFSGASLNGTDKDSYALIGSKMRAGANVTLDEGFTAAGTVRLVGTDITGQFDCTGAQLNGRDKFGSALWIDGMKAGADMFLREIHTTVGAVRMHGADITGTFTCSGVLDGTDNDGAALLADNMKASAGVHFHEGLTAAGAVRLVSADITGTLECTGVTLNGYDSDGSALQAEGIKVSADMLLRQLHTTSGAVMLSGAVISGTLSCSGARLGGANYDRYALVADDIKVGRGVFLPQVYTTSGAVTLAAADITGRFSCSAATLDGTDHDGNALIADNMKATGAVLINEGFTAAGTVSLESAQLGGRVVLVPGDPVSAKGVSFSLSAAGAQVAGALEWRPAGPVCGLVNLEGACVGELKDDWSAKRANANGYWPARGQLRLDGFAYGRFSGKRPPTVAQRLDWIRSQYPSPAAGSTADFATQPYQQLAAVYRQAGQDTQARTVATARRADLRTYVPLNPYRRFGNRFLDWTIKYGYQTWRAGVGLAAVFVIFVIFSFLAQQNHLMEPVGDTEGLHYLPSAARCTSSYPCFYPVGYAIDTVIPLINVHEAAYWGPDGHTLLGQVWVAGTWVATALGWALATLLVAGYTGLVRRD